MEFTLKRISIDGIPNAIAKAELYRYLNEPGEAESICRDILEVDSSNQAALRLFGLSITDQFTGAPTDRYQEAVDTFQKLKDDFERLYYTGIVHERRAKAQLQMGRAPHTVRVLFDEAMKYFEKAEKIQPPGNNDAILRWNRCVRLLQSRLDHHWRKGIEAIDVDDSPPV